MNAWLNRKGPILLSIVLLAAALALAWGCKPPVWQKNAQRLYQSLAQNGADSQGINLKQETPFSWDHLYVFPAGTPEEKMKQTLGLDWDGFKQTAHAADHHVFFLSAGRVVCYLIDTAFSIAFPDAQENTARIWTERSPDVQVKMGTFS